MSQWNHSLCQPCWHETNGARIPVKLKESERERCCRCGVYHRSGIYFRFDPEKMTCKGTHGIHEEVSVG